MCYPVCEMVHIKYLLPIQSILIVMIINELIITEYSGIGYVILGTNLFKGYSVRYKGIFKFWHQQSFSGNTSVYLMHCVIFTMVYK